MRTASIILLALVVAGAGRVEAAPLFASPPHFLSLADRQQIVLFLNEPIAGALAARTGDDRVEIVVPGGVVDPPLREGSSPVTRRRPEARA